MFSQIRPEYMRLHVVSPVETLTVLEWVLGAQYFPFPVGFNQGLDN